MNKGLAGQEKWMRRIEDQYFLVAEWEDQLLGFGSLEKGEYIDLLYIAPLAARRGVATALLQKLEQEARKRGSQSVRSEVSLAAQAFFQGQGYNPIQDQVQEIEGVLIQNTLMKKSLLKA